MRHTLVHDRRGVSTTLSYALNLAIAAILVSALLFAAGSTVQDQRQVSTREELQVIGQRIATAIQEADRLVRTGSDPELRLKVQAPRTVAGLQYTISLRSGSDPAVVLETVNPDITVEVPLQTETGFVETEARGGQIAIAYEPSDGLRIETA